MADWSSQNITLTAKGASALSKVQAGSGSLTITKVVASEQYVAESTLREVTSLSVENLPLTIIDRHEVQDGGSVIQVQLSNLYLGKAFTLNEIGVFATHSDNPSEEFLYIIAQVDAETGDKIPLYATTPVTATYDIYLYNVGADNIEITISSAGLVTYEALNKACDIIQRNTAYEVGDILHSHSLKKGLAIKCTVAGITKSTDTDLSHKNVGDTVEDGTSQWVVIAPSTTADFDAHNHSVDAHPELIKQLIESGLNVIKRSHSYAKGDIAYSYKIPSWAFLECIIAGTTSDGWYFPESSEIKVGDTIVDYTVTWKVRKVADTASKLATPRTLSLTGKAAGSTTFDGSSNASINVTSVNANTASKLSTARKINITGNASGSAAFDGSGDVSISTTVNESKHAAAADTLKSDIASETSTVARPVWLSWEGDNTKQTVSPNLTYTCSTKTLTAANFKGHLAGNADSATNADSASLISPFEIATANAFRNVWFSDSGTNNKACYNPNIQYNPSTNVLKVGTVQGTATNADTVDGVHAASLFYNKGNWASDNWATIGTYQVNDNPPVSGAYKWGQVISSSTNEARFQLYASHVFAGTGHLYYRTGWADDKQPWNTILDSENYNRFAPTKTGVGASGTWGINITGNAASATTATKANTASSVAWAGVTGKPGTYPPSAHNHDSAYPSVTGARASGTWGINISGNAASATNATKWNGIIDDHATENNTDTWIPVFVDGKMQHTDRTKMTVGNADTVDGYHASDLLRILGGNRTPVITDIFDRAGTIDMSTMSAADKAKHKANINKASNVTQNIWNNSTGIHAYGGDTDINGYSHGTLKLTQSYKNFDKILVVSSDDDGDYAFYNMWDVWELANAFASSYRFNLLGQGNIYWTLYGTAKHGTTTNYAVSTDTVWSCQDQDSGIIAIYGIKY